MIAYDIGGPMLAHKAMHEACGNELQYHHDQDSWNNEMCCIYREPWLLGCIYDGQVKLMRRES